MNRWDLAFIVVGIVVFLGIFALWQSIDAFPYIYLEYPNFYEYQYDRYLYERMIYPSWMPTYTPYWLYETEACYCGTGDSIIMEYDNYDYWDNQIAKQQLDDIYTPTQRDANFLISGTTSYYNSIWSTYYGYD